MKEKVGLVSYIVYQYLLLLVLMTINKLLFVYVNIPLKDRGDYIESFGKENK